MRFVKSLAITSGLFATSFAAEAQRFLTDMMDTTTSIGKGIYPLYQKNDRLRFGGYMQPQLQWAETKGAKSFNGGDFSANSNNRFTLRRGRIRIDYGHYDAEGRPLAIFAFQFDGTEKGVNIRDFWGRFYENKLESFAITAGMFARPMGFEVNYSSSERETPERGRMSQILMKTERDLGIMLTYEPRKKGHPLKWFKAELGVFNGQGLAGSTDYDSHKDLIGRISFKPTRIKKWSGVIISGSISGYYGGITSQSAVLYKMSGTGADARMVMDSSASNVDYITPRQYMGADIQIRIPNRKGFTEFRAEYIRGVQTATANNSETPGTYPVSSANSPLPLYTRNFDGAYFYYLQHLGLDRLQLVLKYDWYDPNKKVKGNDISGSKGLTPADIRYDTFGSGLVYYINVHVRAMAYYDWVTNEKTSLAGYTEYLKDNIFTFRLQYRF